MQTENRDFFAATYVFKGNYIQATTPEYVFNDMLSLYLFLILNKQLTR